MELIEKTIEKKFHNWPQFCQKFLLVVFLINFWKIIWFAFTFGPNFLPYLKPNAPSDDESKNNCWVLDSKLWTRILYLMFTKVPLTFRIFIGRADPVPRKTTSGYRSSRPTADNISQSPLWNASAHILDSSFGSRTHQNVPSPTTRCSCTCPLPPGSLEPPKLLSQSGQCYRQGWNLWTERGSKHRRRGNNGEEEDELQSNWWTWRPISPLPLHYWSELELQEALGSGVRNVERRLRLLGKKTTKHNLFFNFWNRSYRCTPESSPCERPSQLSDTAVRCYSGCTATSMEDDQGHTLKSYIVRIFHNLFFQNREEEKVTTQTKLYPIP